ncbi:uncharacterized protein C8Q71DRAFT_860646 [Rhodofomes roseus]|uniref:F-box domain-containing protein n=1 Tax=Rhodofomes roseus TaxID=34475 RepID=A0ABQ8K6P3_9APHY|nr:uncharacterized protein C8Q71DRAFT_860646 [Rhodofomes roseus]KAH9832869.1 hypothetical protein C8Q71DRAFT_860646 [Rhodofomes roseus]
MHSQDMQTSTESADALSAAISASRIEQAPYDILSEILTLLPATDIVHLLSTSRTLRSYIKDERIWRTVSRTYGVTDVANFGGRSFYTVYTELLHKHGPLLGLWAGDHAFSGHILEFRLDKGNEHRQASIIGEFWRFRKPQMFHMNIDQPPEPPRYISAIRIGFPLTLDDGDAPSNDVARVTCCAPANGAQLNTHRAHVHHVEQSTNGIFLGGDFFVSLLQHPDFPRSREATWLDLSRSPIPLLAVAAPTPGRRSLGVINPFFGLAWQFVMSMHVGNTGVVKPRALSLSCDSDCVELEFPALSMRVDNSVTPRYYPLRNEIRQGVEGWSNEWSPASLAGLWLGWYGPHGTECIFIDWNEDTHTLTGLKIIGDENVPRGVPSWQVSTAEPCQLSTEEDLLCAHVLGDRVACRKYRGTGTTSGTGFLQQGHPPIIVAVIGPDELGVIWVDGGFMLQNIRYKGRK